MNFLNKKILTYSMGVLLITLGTFFIWYINNFSSLKKIKKQLDNIDIIGDRLIVSNLIKFTGQTNFSGFSTSFDKDTKYSFSGKISQLFSGFIRVGSGIATLDIQSLKRLYTKSLINGDYVAQLQILLAMYNLSKDKNILWLGINKAILLNQFNLAFKLMKLYYSGDFKVVSKDESQKLLYVLVNTEYFIKNKERFKELLNFLYRNKFIDEQEYIFYESFYLPFNFDFSGYYNVIKYQLLSGKYLEFAKSILKQYDTFKQYRDVPLYYLPSLIAYVWFNNGYFYPAYTLSLKVLKYSSKYILPLQIVAYTLYILQKKEAVEYLKKLQEIDKDNSNFYRFLIGVLLYDLGRYSDAILYFSPLLEIEDFKYKDDVVRYLFLSYIKLRYFSKAFNIYRNFLKINESNVYDFWSFFNYFLYDNEGYNSISGNKQDLLDIIKFCYKKIGKHHIYVCRFGKGLFYYRLGYIKKAVDYLKYLVKFYPKPIFFKILGDYYFSKGEYGLAKRYYLYGLQYTQNDDLRKYFRLNLLEILKKNF